MTKHESISIICKILTLGTSNSHKNTITSLIKNSNINWDDIVKISTQYYVFPSLYTNLHSANMLSLLPDDLVAFMEHIYSLNAERNKAILTQCHEINQVLNQHHIFPIFLKGTGYLLSNLYTDIGERMIGDIDILVPKKRALEAWKIMIQNGYINLEGENTVLLTFSKHGPRQAHPNKIAALEVHRKLLRNSTNTFYENTIGHTVKTESGLLVLNHQYQIWLSALSNYLEDFGYYGQTTPLRNFYDTYLLSQTEDTKNSISLIKKYSKYVNSYLITCNYFFNIPNKLTYNNTTEATTYLTSLLKDIENPKLQADKIATTKQRIKPKYWKTPLNKAIILCKALYSKPYYNHVIKKIKEKLTL